LDEVSISDNPGELDQSSFVRFQAFNLYGDQSRQRYNTDRWVTVSAFCHSLESMCLKNSELAGANKSSGNSGLHSHNLSCIPLAEYIKRIACLFDCSKECFVIALEYIYQLIRVRPDVEVNYSTVHQLIVAALRVSHKFVDDNYIVSSYYAYVVNLPVNTIAVFEAQLLFFLKFDLNLRPGKYYTRYSMMLANNRGPRKVVIRP